MDVPRSGFNVYQLPCKTSSRAPDQQSEQKYLWPHFTPGGRSEAAWSAVTRRSQLTGSSSIWWIYFWRRNCVSFWVCWSVRFGKCCLGKFPVLQRRKPGRMFVHATDVFTVRVTLPPTGSLPRDTVCTDENSRYQTRIVQEARQWDCKETICCAFKRETPIVLTHRKTISPSAIMKVFRRVILIRVVSCSDGNIHILTHMKGSARGSKNCSVTRGLSSTVVTSQRA